MFTNILTSPKMKHRGALLQLRPIRPDDAPQLQQLHERLSAQSIYFRYLRMHKPTEAELNQICQQDDRRGAAYVATVAAPQQAIIGMAHYVVDPSEPLPTAEFAMVVDDHYQGRGLGRRLFSLIYHHARRQGIRTLVAYVHPSNDVMVHMLRTSDCPVTERNLFDVREFRLALPAPRTLEQIRRYPSASWLRTLIDKRMQLVGN